MKTMIVAALLVLACCSRTPEPVRLEKIDEAGC